MRDNPTYPESDPRHHTTKIRGMLAETPRHARDDVKRVDEPRAQALFETTAKVLQGLDTEYDHFKRTSEPAWRGDR